MLSTSMLFGNQRTNQSAPFADPYVDLASMVMPRSAKDILDLCEKLWMRNGMYRMAAGKIVRYFITRVAFGNTPETTATRFRTFLENRLRVTEELTLQGDDVMCFAGSTPTVTRNGVVRISDLTGKTVDVLSRDGVYRPARFKSHGQQQLFEITFSDGRQVYATAEHEWHVLASSGRTVVVPTTRLKGRSIQRVVAPRPPKNADYEEGVRHGFVFGDGSVYNKNRKTPKSAASFFGEKDGAILPFFEGHGGERCSYLGGKQTVIHGLPAYYKLLPAVDCSASYWYGFVCGFIAADGYVDRYGCTMLAQASRATLEAVVLQLPRIGMVAGPVGEYDVHTEFTRRDGHVDAYDASTCRVTLLKQFMALGDHLIPSHAANFAAAKRTSYGKYIRVARVEPTGIVDTVYCCVEPETHTFVINNGVLTGNCYGNAMSSVVVPFTRILVCNKCRSEVVIDHADCVFENWQFRAYCHKCKERCTHTHDDRPSRDESRIRIKRWAPQEFQLVHHFHSQDTEYYWRIPAQLRTLIGGGSMFHVKQTPWEIIQAVKGDTFFKFNRGVIYHMKESTVSGVDAQGWGVSRMLSTFAQAYYVQMLTRYNEALVADYLTPMRIVSPKAGSTSTDPAMIASMQQFKARFAAMVAQHRRDPATWHFMPFPVEYQALGGEVKLASHDLINQAIDQQLSAIGIPPDLYRGTMELQVMPTALRLFQASWPHLVSAFNGWLEHVAEAVCTHMTWDKPESVRLEPVTTADDVELRQTWLQLAASNLVSRRTAFAPWQLDPVEEQRQVLQETKKFEEMQREMQEDVEQRQLSRQSVAGAGQGQAAPPGGAPPGAMGVGQQAVSGGGITIEDMQAQAEEMAQQLVRMPEGPRKRQLQAVRTQAPVLHSLVTATMAKIRSQAGSAGRDQLAQGQM